MPGAGGGRQRTDHAGRGPGAGKAPGRDIPDPGHPVQFRRRRGQLFRVGAGPAAAVLGGRGSDAARIPDPRSRLRPDGDARQGRRNFPSHRCDGDRGGKGPRRQEHARAVSMITGLDHLVVLLEDIEAGAKAYQILLGCAPSWRGSSDGSETVLFTLDNMTLELMAPSGHSPTAERIRGVIKVW